jgi:hypothetical protein
MTTSDAKWKFVEALYHRRLAQEDDLQMQAACDSMAGRYFVEDRFDCAVNVQRMGATGGGLAAVKLIRQCPASGTKFWALGSNNSSE